MPQPKPPESYRKNCTLCSKPRDVLVRCQIDPASLPPTTIPTSASETAETPKQNTATDENNDNDNDNPNPSIRNLNPQTWHFVCPGSCWRLVSGGVIDGDLEKGREGYRYGGMWKNKHAGVSAKVPKRLRGKLGRGGGEGEKGGGEGDGEGEERGVGDGDERVG